MAARMMSLKQPSWIYCTCLWLAALAVVNAEEVPQIRPDIKGNTNYPEYLIRLNLDLNTVNKYFFLSEDNRKITLTNTLHPYPDHPDRFNGYAQVLCRERVSGRAYWEVDWSGAYAFIAVSYKSISRKGDGNECAFGHNDQSWSLFCSPGSYAFRHNNIHTELTVKPVYRVGVYVDHRAGILSFYSVSGDTMIHIHTVQTTFTQPLYPGFGLGSGYVKLL